MSNREAKRAGRLVLGAGELGIEVLRALAASAANDVTVLLRPQGSTGQQVRDELARLGVAIIEADLATAPVEALAGVFGRFAQVICCTGFVGGAGTQRRITEAAILSGVDHYIPWQFGIDYDVVGRGSGQSVWDEQLDVRDSLRAQDRVRWTIVSTGIFTSFVFLDSFGVVDLKRRIVRALGSWDHRLTATTPEDVGRLTALAALTPDAFADRIVHVAGDTFTYAGLADTVEQVLGVALTRELLMLEALREESDGTDIMADYRLAFARPSGIAWPVAGTLNDRLGMAMVDVATWLRRWRDYEGATDDGRPVTDERAVRMARPELLIASPEPSSALIAALTQRYYGSWNTSSDALFAETVSPSYIDRTPPAERTPDVSGLADAQRRFRVMFPDGRVHVLQQVIAGDRVVSHLRVTGRLTSQGDGAKAHGERIDYRATDIMRVENGMIVENWHVEDHEALSRQISAGTS